MHSHSPPPPGHQHMKTPLTGLCDSLNSPVSPCCPLYLRGVAPRQNRSPSTPILQQQHSMSRQTDHQHLDDERIRLQRSLVALECANVLAWKAHDALDRQRVSDQNEIDRLQLQLSDLLKTNNDRSEIMVAIAKQCQRQMESIDDTTERLRELDWSRLSIEKFPDDILRLIIMQATRSRPKFRWTAMGVCRHWRAVAETTPSLWSDIRIRFADHDEGLLDVARRALTFGGQSAIRMEFLFGPRPSRAHDGWNDGWPPADNAWGTPTQTPAAPPNWMTWGTNGYPIDDKPNYEFAFDYVNAVVPHLPRCHELLWYVHNPGPGYSSPRDPEMWTWEASWIFRQMRTVDLSNLKRLEVDLGERYRGNHHPKAVGAVCYAAQNLTYIDLRFARWKPIRTTALQSLHLVSCEIAFDQLLSALADQHSLLSLRIWCCHFFRRARNPDSDDESLSESSKSHRIIRLPSLEEFVYNWNSSNVNEMLFFSRLSCPNLVRAVLRWSEAWEVLLSEVLGFFLRSTQLAELALSLRTSPSLEPIFQGLPSVRRFLGLINPGPESYGGSIGLSFLEAASAPGILPSLKHLALQCTPPEDALLTWVEDRRSSTQTEDLLTFSGAVTVEDVGNQEWKDALRELGVEIEEENGWDEELIYWPDVKPKRYF
ncbi:hypothetical protein CALCODRAFT_154243 [Calocera cornea HHB12733]|uniref:Uncharacterized protein n=1 Tax=Calocera cornea HHB12733 TaxID=1353952 RepID=A0A165CM91_9BASI|nr:hypothetical protein CALCODRAFT_154243 [Calocera cornea HHB12733]